jgi:hypothetical protein
MTVSTWLRKHHACPEGYKWAVSNCKTMQQVWDTASPEWLVWVATRPGVLDDITLRRFACWCARQVWHLLTDERSRHAVETAERFCDGKATRKELDAAWAAASAAARAAAMAAAWAAAMAAARYAARDAARAMEWAEALAAQAQWLRINAKPNFDD